MQSHRRRDRDRCYASRATPACHGRRAIRLCDASACPKLARSAAEGPQVPAGSVYYRCGYNVVVFTQAASGREWVTRIRYHGWLPESDADAEFGAVPPAAAVGQGAGPASSYFDQFIEDVTRLQTGSPPNEIASPPQPGQSVITGRVPETPPETGAMGSDPRRLDANQVVGPPVWSFRGLVPGRTTEAALLADAQWGQPVERASLGGDATALRYKVASYDVTISLRAGIVQTIDVALPPGVSVAQAVRVFRLKDPLPEAPLPPPAQFGPALGPGLRAQQYACARVIVFVEETPSGVTARQVRFYDHAPTGDPPRR